MVTTMAQSGSARLHIYLREQGVAYKEREHAAVYTAQQTAQAEHLPGRLMAKPVIVSTERGMFMLVLPATHQVLLPLAAQALGVEHVRLAHEAEFAPLFPDCEVGAMPALGNLYGFPVYVDESLTEDPEITFPAGSHRTTVTVAYRDFVRMVQPRVARFGLPHA